MRSFLGLSTIISSLVALAVARNIEIRHKPTLAKRLGYAHHHQVARESDRPLTNEVAVLGARDLEKRFEGARFTYYEAGLGACGRSNVNSDFIVALNAAQYDSYDGHHCFETITITVNGQTLSAQIMDRCEVCPIGGLDLSHGLFNKFAEDSVGVLTGSWYFSGGTPDVTTPTTTTYVYVQPTPTTTYIQPTSTTPAVYIPSSSSSSSSSRSSTSSALNALWSSSPNGTNPSTLEQLNLVLVNLGSIIVAGRSG